MATTYDLTEEFPMADALDGFDEPNRYMWEIDPETSWLDIGMTNRLEQQVERVIKAFEQDAERAELFGDE